MSTQTIKRIAVESVLAATLLIIVAVFWEELYPGAGRNRPRILNPEVTCLTGSRQILVSLDYENVAGDIADAKLTVVISVRQSRFSDRYEIARTKLSKFVDRDYFNPVSPDSRTAGRLVFKLPMPRDMEIYSGEHITGFGLALVDALGHRSWAFFKVVEGEEATKMIGLLCWQSNQADDPRSYHKGGDFSYPALSTTLAER